MQAYRVETVLQFNGTVTLEHLPFQAGEAVEVIVLARPPESKLSHSYPLRGTCIRYVEPTEPVAQDDWEVSS